MKLSEDEKWIEVEASDPAFLTNPSYLNWRICNQCYSAIYMAWWHSHADWHSDHGD